MIPEFSNPDPAWAALFGAQVDSLFASGLVVSYLYRRAGLGDVPFDAVTDNYPARLTGVSPGDARLRVRSEDLSDVIEPLPGDVVAAAGSGILFDVISVAVEFGGAVYSLQVRRRAATPLVSSPTGLALPVLTRSGRNAIANVTAGMVIFQSDNVPGVRVFNGANWVRFAETND